MELDITFLMEEGVEDAFLLTDEEIESEYYDEVWKKSYKDDYKNSIWQGHSDFGYLTGDFDYTALDHNIWTHPWNLITGTSHHFRPLEGAFGSELQVGLAIRSGNVEYFQAAMHMGQDYFSHYGAGYTPLTHALAPEGGHAPDNPYYRPEDVSNRITSAAYRNANRWTREREEIWYLFWDLDTWWKLCIR